MSIFSKFRISTKLMLTILPLVFIAIGTSAYLNTRYQQEEMLKQAQVSAQTYADIIRESLVNMMITREKVDDEYLAQMKTVRDIRDLQIHFSAAGLHLKDIFQDEEREKRLQTREQKATQLNEEEKKVFSTGEPVWRRHGEIYNAIIPFKATAKCRQCHSVEEGYVLGAAQMNISLNRIQTAINDNWIRSLWLLYAFTSLALLISVILYRFLVARRMTILVSATKDLGRGNLDHKISMNNFHDEIGELAGAFDTMRVQLKAAQEQAIHSERLATIGQMASSIVHDFRTPMSTINLAIESLQRGKNFTPEKEQQWYGMIRDAIHRMVTMAQELLDFSRGEITLNKTTFSLDEFTDLLTKSVKINLEHSKIQLNIQNEFHSSATFDVDRLHRALENMINNSQDAMPDGGEITLRVRLEQNALVFQLTDTGVGIPPEIKDKIFDAFVTAGKKKGTGLGLAITKRIIDQHGGTINVESERGKGTTFTIKLPIA